MKNKAGDRELEAGASTQSAGAMRLEAGARIQKAHSVSGSSLQPPASSRDSTAQLSKLRWRCRRGMRELDVVLARYLERDYPAGTQTERRAFEALLELQDPDLYSLLIGRDGPPVDPDMTHVLSVLTRYRV